MGQQSGRQRQPGSVRPGELARQPGITALRDGQLVAQDQRVSPATDLPGGPFSSAGVKSLSEQRTTWAGTEGGLMREGGVFGAWGLHGFCRVYPGGEPGSSGRSPQTPET